MFYCTTINVMFAHYYNLGVYATITDTDRVNLCSQTLPVIDWLKPVFKLSTHLSINAQHYSVIKLAFKEDV